MDTVTYETRTWLEGYCTEVRRGVWRMMRLPTRRYHVWSFFFHGFALTRLWFTSNQADSAKIKPNQVVSAKDRNGRSGPRWPKQAEISLESCRNSQNWLWMRPKHPKFVIPQFYSEYLLLLFCFVFLAFFFLCFVNQGIVMCFLRIF